MSTEPGAELRPVAETEKPTRSKRAKAAATPRAKAAKKPATARRRTAIATDVEPQPAPVPVVPVVPAVAAEPIPPRRRRRRHLPRLGAALLFAAAAAAAIVVALAARDGGSPPQEVALPEAPVPVAVSPTELREVAATRETPVYWAGLLPGRALELTTTRDGTFVRYLSAETPVGDAGRALTIATYPLADAYATATSQARTRGMASRRTGGGIAVWSRARPTSVYLASPGVEQLVEVYAPTAAEARRLALSGRVRPVG